ncbi:flagellar protein [Brevibacillus borstelensis]|uniref:flagellin N-terminal helical domain-containing protein n=1 Tax=Brevibacillus borstelensis TaxID=45462 RepID=UPI001561DFC2|nr:flagellin [Brevibacillus borstelensis]MBE5396799.1 flagellar protein [Brevibacillus borstelensis]
MRINHNIQALNAYRQLSQNQGVVSKHLEKLSSGLRINRAADDAAGLAISEKMRSQIRGLAMAERNTMDGISLIQTAEGALGTTHEILQRMRELAVQAANGTLEEPDRAAIQNEIDQLTLEIDRIATTTQFNSKPLLRGAKEGRAFASSDAVTYTNSNNGTWEGVITADSTSKGAVELFLEPGFGNLTEAQADGITFEINGKIYELDVTGTGTTAGVGDKHVAVNIGSWATGGADPDEDAKTNVNAVLAALKDAIMKNDPTFDSAASTVVDAVNTTPSDGAFDSNTGKLVLKTVKNMTPDEAETVNVGAKDNTGAPLSGAKFYEEGKPSTTVSTLKANTDATAEKTISLSFTETPKAGDMLVIDGVTIIFDDQSATGYDPAAKTLTVDVANKTMDEVLKDLDKQLTNITSNYPNDLAALNSHSISGNSLVLSTKKTDDGKSFGTGSNGLDIRIFDKDFVSTAGQDLKLNMQIGANASESMEVSIGVMDAAALGLARAADHKTEITTPGANAVAGIDVSSNQEAAKKAISIIDNAIHRVSEERSKLGAYQNRMEHTVTNLSTANENLTAAESRIRDADMAMEMTNFTKNNIINQAATAMLAQANQLPQGILQLLK